MWSVIRWIFSLFSYTSHLWTVIISRYPVLISGSVQYPHHHTQSTRCAGSLSLFGNCFTLLHIKLLQGKSFYQLQSCSLLVVSLISIWRLRLLMHVDIDSSRIRHLLAYLFYTVRKMYVYCLHILIVLSLSEVSQIDSFLIYKQKAMWRIFELN